MRYFISSRICYRSMLPDVVDDFVTRNPSCKGLEPLFFSCYAFCVKMAGGLSVGLSTMTLQWDSLPNTTICSKCFTHKCWSITFLFFAFLLQLCWIQSRCVSPWWRSGNGSDRLVLACSYHTSADRDDHFLLLSNQWEAMFADAGTTDHSPVSGWDKNFLTGCLSANIGLASFATKI